jgi:hypothetical protein
MGTKTIDRRRDRRSSSVRRTEDQVLYAVHAGVQGLYACVRVCASAHTFVRVYVRVRACLGRYRARKEPISSRKSSRRLVVRFWQLSDEDSLC